MQDLYQALWRWDLDTFRAIHLGWHGPALDWIWLALSTLGLGHVQMPLYAVAVALFGRTDAPLPGRLWANLKNPAYFVGPMLAAFALSGLVGSTLMKSLIQRDRPSQLAFSVPEEGFFYSAFPSGHTTTSFGMAFLWLMATWDTRYRWTGFAALAVAAGIGFSRIARGVHWPTDVLGGVLAGLAGACVAWLLTLRVRSRTGFDGETPLRR